MKIQLICPWGFCRIHISPCPLFTPLSLGSALQNASCKNQQSTDIFCAKEYLVDYCCIQIESHPKVCTLNVYVYVYCLFVVVCHSVYHCLSLYVFVLICAYTFFMFPNARQIPLGAIKVDLSIYLSIYLSNKDHSVFTVYLWIPMVIQD